MLKKVTLCGSTRFEAHFKLLSRELAFAGYIVHSLSAYPSENGGRDWLTDERKEIYDLVYLGKIADSHAIVVIDGMHEGKPYTGHSTQREIYWAGMHDLPIVYFSQCDWNTENLIVQLARVIR